MNLYELLWVRGYQDRPSESSFRSDTGLVRDHSSWVLHFCTSGEWSTDCPSFSTLSSGMFVEQTVLEARNKVFQSEGQASLLPLEEIPAPEAEGSSSIMQPTARADAIWPSLPLPEEQLRILASTHSWAFSSPYLFSKRYPFLLHSDCHLHSDNFFVSYVHLGLPVSRKSG